MTLCVPYCFFITIDTLVATPLHVTKNKYTTLFFTRFSYTTY
jgi:hypothetical protein